ncbi:sugar transferase [Roseomonas sp. HJA6]|uniref:Sugar transferase n=1 Tax=Roseomonas alba TaxID=2846776 RepID=A0ABS7A3B6_9PROT|nr:exopolysaccharide biosynthesis polyprenyl glycosylphosphotransferase [Neoroseomonas alba]MBW6396779.1 sugar transferase [Neoroseomonas alba]
MTRVTLVEAPSGGRDVSRPHDVKPAPPARRSTALMAGMMPAVDAALLLVADLVVGLGLGDADGPDVGRQLAATIVGAGLFVAMAALAGQYRGEDLDRRIAALGPLSAIWGLAVMLTLTIAFLWDGGVAVTRAWVVGWFLVGGGALVAWRHGAAAALRRWRVEGRLAERVLVVGGGQHVRRLVDHLAEPRAAGLVALLGIYSLDGAEAPHPDAQGWFEDLLRDAPGLGVDAVLIALPWSEPERIAEACMRLRELPVDVRLAPDLAGYDLPTAAPHRIAGRVGLEVWGRPLRDWRGVVKRAEDLVIGSALVLLFAPVMALAALAIRLDSRGPVLLRQRRYGLGNTPISIFKFRTMYADKCDLSGRVATVRGDPRVTRVGRFLRRTSLDELPQLFNVVLGTMSLVGPRAHPVEMQVGGRYYHEVVSHYAARHRMKPGITGLAQINGYRGLVDTLEKAQRRLDYDLHYVEHWSLAMDIRILFATVFRGFTSDSAF